MSAPLPPDEGRLASFDAERIYARLPVLLRERDAELAAWLARDAAGGAPVDDHGPLKSLVSVLAEQLVRLAEDVEQLYEDQFVETAAAWLLPHLGELVQAHILEDPGGALPGARAQVADTIALRRRKGTLAVLEEIAESVTGWPARAVEFFPLCTASQFMNHVRPAHRVTVDLRDRRALGRIGTPFDELPRRAEMRRIASGQGSHNLPNVGIFLFREQAHREGLLSPRRVAEDEARFRLHPSGRDLPLARDPASERHLADRALESGYALPLTRDELRDNRYGDYGRSVIVMVDGTPLPESEIRVCNLADAAPPAEGDPATPDDAPWQNTEPIDDTRLDPALGRLVLGRQHDPAKVQVSFHTRVMDTLGGGAYDRRQRMPPELPPERVVITTAAELDAELANPNGSRTLEIRSSERFLDPLPLHAEAGHHVALVAGEGFAPTFELSGAPWDIQGAEGARISLSGIRLVGGSARIQGELDALVLHDCTFLPGLRLDKAGQPVFPDAPSLRVEAPTVSIAMRDCFSGPLLAGRETEIDLEDCVVQAHARDALAIGWSTGVAGTFSAARVTCIGRVAARLFGTVTDTILDAAGAEAVTAEHRQTGCVRFSYVPEGSRVPRAYRCITGAAANRLRPSYDSLRFGDAGYVRLSESGPVELREGGEHGCPMGIHARLCQPRRIHNLSIRLDEYMRFSMEAGVFFAP